MRKELADFGTPFVHRFHRGLDSFAEPSVETKAQ
jgi:hypothetical protein